MTLTRPDVPAIHDPAIWPSTQFIQGATDEELLISMGVQTDIRAAALRFDTPFPPMVQLWLDNLADIYRPSVNRQLAGPPGMCGRSLVLWGDPGTGKSVTAVRILLAAVKSGVPNEIPERMHVASRYNGWCQGYWFDWQELSDDLRKQSKDEGDTAQWDETEALLHGGSTGGEKVTNGGQFLVIDDVSRERSTVYNLDRLQYYLRYRQARGIPTILTTNTPPVQWESTLSVSLGNFMARTSFAVGLDDNYRDDITVMPISKRSAARVVLPR